MTDQAITLKSEASYRIMTKKRKFCPKYLNLSKPKPQFWYYLPSLNATLMRKSIKRNTWEALSLVFQPININSHIKFTLHYSYKSCKWSFNLWYQNRANLKGVFFCFKKSSHPHTKQNPGMCVCGDVKSSVPAGLYDRSLIPLYDLP